jgi:hypothetical protein
VARHCLWYDTICCSSLWQAVGIWFTQQARLFCNLGNEVR